MSNIQCLGAAQLPENYRRFMLAELAHYQRARKLSPKKDSPWEIEYLPRGNPDAELYKVVAVDLLTESSKAPKPFHCMELDAFLAKYSDGIQQHSCMTMVETVLHSDEMSVSQGFEKPMILVMPLSVGPRNTLEVAGEEKRMREGFVYAFDQRLPHRLFYNVCGGPSLKSRPASILTVNFLLP